MIALRLQQLDAALCVLVQPRARRREAGLHQVLLAPGDQPREVVAPWLAERERGEGRREPQSGEIEGVQQVGIVDRRLAHSQSVARRPDLVGGSGDPFERAPRSGQGGARDFADLLGRLHQEDAVPTVRGHGCDSRGPHGRRVGGLPRLAAIVEATLSGIGAEEHRGVGSRGQERLEGCFVAGAENPDHAALLP